MRRRGNDTQRTNLGKFDSGLGSRVLKVVIVVKVRFYYVVGGDKVTPT